MNVGLWVLIMFFFLFKVRLTRLCWDSSFEKLKNLRIGKKNYLLFLVMLGLVADILSYIFLIDTLAQPQFTLFAATILSYRVVIVNNTFTETRKRDLFTLNLRTRFLRGYELLVWIEVLLYPYLLFRFINLLL